MANPICGDAYDERDGSTYACYLDLGHKAKWHTGSDFEIGDRIISWSDDAPGRRANREAASDE